MGRPFSGPIPCTNPGAGNSLGKPEVHELLQSFQDLLAKAEPFEPAVLEDQLRRFCEARGIGTGALIHPLRVATTGTEVGPGVFDCLAILGREETLRRISLALEKVGRA